tara:strand:- start:606 stop:1217 length:612 start_codon:yes stop_codon:yes gene_type:complete
MKIVYILINQSMPDLIKVGITEDLERRMKELDKTGTPLPFECFYAVEIDESLAPKIEKKIHEGFDDKRLRQNREFFSATPEQAKSILEIAEIMGGKDVTPKEDIVETPQDKQALENAKKQRSKFNFQMIDLQPGTILKFRKDETITCEVHDDTKIKFRDKITSLSNAAEIILKEMGYDWSAYQGPIWWMYEGRNLRDIRRESE